jgi:feruloyl esterase
MKNTLLVVALTAVPKLMLGAPVVKCADLAKVSFGAEVKIDSATLAPATEKTSENCDVRGTIWPEAKFALKLPVAWNSRFQMVGNGGTAGVLSLAAVDAGVRKGYATVSTDTGHDAAKEPLATFGRRGPDNPNADRKVIDFGYMAVHETAVLAKKIIKAYYGEPPRYSYWVGCSTGGRQGMNEAQRFPEDFDGLVIGAPGLNGTGSNMRRIWNAVVQSGPGAIAMEKLPVLANAVYKKCDSVDGLEDGLIDDPRKCAFDPARDLPKCAADTDGPSCFTGAQMEALKKIYNGVTNSSGKKIFPGEPLGAEIAVQGKSGWEQDIAGPSKVSLPRSESYMQYMYLDPAPGPGWKYTMYDFDKDPPKMAKPAEKINATNPDLRPLKQRGGKIIHYHGWADPMLTAFMSVDYYESALRTMGEKETKEFYRLFLIPGMFHCSGGVGCGTVDWLTPMVDWVEKGRAPEKLIGAHVEGGETKRTRPLCPYPEVAKYQGTGSIDDAGNFNCVQPGRR